MGKEIMLRTLPTSNQQINLQLYKRRIKCQHLTILIQQVDNQV